MRAPPAIPSLLAAAVLAGAAPAADPVIAGTAPLERDLRVTLSHATALPGERLVATYRGIPSPRPGDWITLAKAADPDRSYGQWSWLRGQGEGTVPFVAPPEPGTYELRLFLDWPRGQYAVAARSEPLRVVAPGGAPRPTADLTGVWIGDDGSRCRLTQHADEVWWLCDPARRGPPAMVGHGSSDGARVTLRIAEVPRAPAPRPVELERDPSRPPPGATLVLVHEAPGVLRAATAGPAGSPPRTWRRGR